MGDITMSNSMSNSMSTDSIQMYSVLSIDRSDKSDKSDKSSLPLQTAHLCLN